MFQAQIRSSALGVHRKQLFKILIRQQPLSMRYARNFKPREYADPVQQCMRMGLGFDFVADIVSQALAWNYLGERLDALRLAGLRRAMLINLFFQEPKCGSTPFRRCLRTSRARQMQVRNSHSPSSSLRAMKSRTIRTQGFSSKYGMTPMRQLRS